jgi:hypothetical protein
MKFFTCTKAERQRMTNVGASLLAKGSIQSVVNGLEDRFREQARSHRILVS